MKEVNIGLLLFILLLLGSPARISAQNTMNKCGYKYLGDAIVKNILKPRQSNVQYKATIQSTIKNNIIPVVFHIIINNDQLGQLGGHNNIATLIDSQINLLNKDFNGQNPDSILIPVGFKQLYGSVNLRFALAHTKYDGTATPGYEIKMISDNGFNIDGTAGSQIAFSDSKYSYSGGLDAWDETTYLNIWVTNLLENWKPTTIQGLTIAPSVALNYEIPSNEIGINVSYQLWRGIFNGRTLTHELGHYLSLKHIWGDDNGLCVNNGGSDDGINDTPPQANANFGCPDFPKYDNCTYTGAGTMFMNYMDYTDEKCQFMFTIQQAERMNKQVEPFGYAYSLLLHPQVLEFPILTSKEEYVIYPNPAKEKVNIVFNKTPHNLKAIRLFNNVGQCILSTSIEYPKGYYSLHLTGLSIGLYMIEIEIGSEKKISKLNVF